MDAADVTDRHVTDHRERLSGGVIAEWAELVVAGRGAGRVGRHPVRAARWLPAARDQGPHRPPRHRVANHLGRVRWLVEGSISWLLRFKRLGLRYERVRLALRLLLTLGCVLINLRRLVQQES